MRKETTDAAPHECTECKEPAYIGFTGPARCTNHVCSRFDEQIWKEHVMAIPDEGDPEPLSQGISLADELFADEDTQPQYRFPGGIIIDP